jgi:phenylpropionate dioxygenase-like ring-hydroxylating dioxygenase large terminal subunit
MSSTDTPVPTTLSTGYFTYPKLYRRDIEDFYFGSWICAGRVAHGWSYGLYGFLMGAPHLDESNFRHQYYPLHEVAKPGFQAIDVTCGIFTNREDWAIVDLSQAHIQSRSYTRGPYSCREELLHSFNQTSVSGCLDNLQSACSD